MVDTTTNNLKYCHDAGVGNGQWSALGSKWSINGDYVFPSTTTSNPNITVSIGTIIPDLQLTLDSDGGILAMGEFGSGNIPANFSVPESNTVSRMMWYPAKAALTIGWFESYYTNEFSDSKIGNYSFSFTGLSTFASGIASTTGAHSNSTVTGNYAVLSAGLYSTISGDYATSTSSQNSLASGRSSVVDGILCQSLSDYSTAFGYTNYAIGIGSTVIGSIGSGGNNTLTTSIWEPQIENASYSTISGGSYNHAKADYATVNGKDNDADAYGTIVGGTNNLATGSHATVSFGSEGQAIGSYSTVVGGNHNIANGDGATIAGGAYNSTSANYGSVLGGYTNSAGQSSTVPGGNTNMASGINSVASLGTNNTVAGNDSWVGGRFMNLTNTANRSFVWGYSTSTVSITTADAFIIAPGTNNPKLGIRNLTPSAILDVLTSPSDTDDLFAITSTTVASPGDIFIVKNNGYVGINNSNPLYPLQISNFAGPNGVLTVGGVWTTPSSRKYKDNIKPLNTQEAVDTVLKLHPVTYNYKVDKNEHHVGFIAEDVPDIVATQGRKSIDPMNVTAVLTAVLKQQQKVIQQQSEILDQLDYEIQNLEKSTPIPLQ